MKETVATENESQASACNDNIVHSTKSYFSSSQHWLQKTVDVILLHRHLLRLFPLCSFFTSCEET